MTDIARDRSVAGRARLFAFLAALLVSRWITLTIGERDQLAELVALLWPKGDAADRDRLTADLAGKADLPASLRALLPMPAAPSLPKLAPSKRTITVTVSRPIIVKRTAPAGPAAPTASGPHVAAVTAPSVQISPVARPAVPVSARLPDMVPDERFLAADLPPVAEHQPQLPPSVPDVAFARGAAIDGDPGDSEARGDDAPDGEAIGDAVKDDAASHPTEMAKRDAVIADGRISDPPPPPSLSSQITIDPAGQPTMTAPTAVAPMQPRENSHRLSPALLAEVLAQGDLARFEVMLAQLSGLRAPLLRRLLCDGGGEGFAILARAAGVDKAGFDAQLQDWRRCQRELGHIVVPPDGRDRKLGDFFNALTEQQVDRLIQRWRSADDRLFSKATS